MPLEFEESVLLIKLRALFAEAIMLDERPDLVSSNHVRLLFEDAKMYEASRKG